MFYGVKDIMTILQIKQSKAYSIIKALRNSLEAEGYISPPAGRIQKRYFCDRYNLNLKDCEQILKAKGKGAA